MATLLAEMTDIQTAIAEEQAASPGLIEIRLYTPEPISKEVMQNIFDHLYYNGIDVRGVYQRKTKGLWYVGVRYRKPAPSEAIAALPLAIIPLIAFGFIMTLVGIGIFRLGDITKNLMPIILAGGGLILLTAVALRRPAEEAAKAYAARKF